MLEVELKIRVPALEPVRKRLLEHNAQFRERIHEHDRYYNAPHRDFRVTDEAVRVRYTDSHAVVTYKGPKITRYGFKAREELTTAVEDGPVFEQMLERLGFTKTSEVNKRRENYRLGNAAISLDEVEELGTFVEIEVMTAQEAAKATAEIKKISEELGISGEPVLASYLELLLAKRSEAQS